MSASKPIPVTGVNGLHGFIDPAAGTSEDQKVLLHLDQGPSLWVPAGLLAEQPDGGYYLPLSREQIEGDRSDEVVVPVIEERAAVNRKETTTGLVRIIKQVHEREEEIDEPRFKEAVDVERVPVNRVIAEPVGVRTEGDTLIIPVLEEVLVVEKRILLKEEVRVTRRREEVHEPKQVTLREEEVRVERTQPDKGKKE